MTDYFISTINKVLHKIYTTIFASHLQNNKAALAQCNHSILQSCEADSRAKMKTTELCASPHPCRDKFFLRVLLKVNEQGELAYWAGENT